MGGMTWYDDQFTYHEYWLRGPNRKNDLKLAIQSIREDADRFHYKGRGKRVVSINEHHGKDEIIIKVTLEDTERKRRKRKRK
jgi:hypothetical protein